MTITINPQVLAGALLLAGCSVAVACLSVGIMYEHQCRVLIRKLARAHAVMLRVAEQFEKSGYAWGEESHDAEHDMLAMRAFEWADGVRKVVHETKP